MNNKEELPNGGQLLKLIANKEEDVETAQKAFRLFVSIFESKINKDVEIFAIKNGYINITVLLFQ